MNFEHQRLNLFPIKEIKLKVCCCDFLCVSFLKMFSQRDNEAKNADDVLFDMFRNETTDLLPIGKFLAVSSIQYM